jgi:phage terminase large subunit GpA-like protein
MTPAGQISATEQAFLRTFRGAIKPPLDIKVSDWADRYRILSTRSSPEPGRWRTSRTPYLRDVMDALSPSTPWQVVVLMAGS